MLTPQEISRREFVRAVFGGYDMSVVDDFLAKLEADYSALFKENAALKDENAALKREIRVLVEKAEKNSSAAEKPGEYC
jgi:cell division initiation protein